jgi:hypothetical protein
MTAASLAGYNGRTEVAPGPTARDVQGNGHGPAGGRFWRARPDQIDLRGITKEQVITALRNPTETGLPTTMFRFRIRRQLGRKKALDVVYEEHPKHILIITTFYKDFK